MNRCIFFSVVVVMSVATCSSEPALPILTVVEPERLSNASAHEIVVKGEHFFVNIYADLNAPEQSRLNTTFGLTLVRNDAVVDLIDVRWVSEFQLRAWVPAEVPLGVFRLELVDPRGRRAALPDALLVYSDPQQSGAQRWLGEEDCVGGPCSAREECEDGCCVHDKDSDGDGHVAAACGGDDCDDESADTFPGAAPNDDPDACMKDADLDGYADSSPPGDVTAGTDCADSPGSDPACNGLDGFSCRPGLTDSDLCDGADNDCDGLLDEDPDILWYRDADGDGFTGTETILSCKDPDGAFGSWLATATTEDCDDTPLACGVNCYPGNSAPDICDGNNQDCNGQVDEDPDIVWYHDADGDGFTNPADTSLSCVDPDGAATAWVAAPTAVDCDDDPVACGGGCYPGNVAQDVCDGANQDCDADVDEDPDILWYRDADGDGFTGTETILSCLDPDGAGAEWLASATAEVWLNRKEITFDNTASAENLVDFPVLVTLDASNLDFAKVKAGGVDIRFVDDDSTALAYEIQSWDDGDETATVWVKVQQINLGVNTDYIHIYYNNISASDAQNAAAVWDASHVGVWHLDENGTGVADEFGDSSGAGNHGQGGAGTASQTPTQITPGIGGNAQSFDNIDDHVNIDASASLTMTNDITIEAWIKRNTTNEFSSIICSLDPGNSWDYAFYVGTSPLRDRLVFWSDNGSPMVLGSAARITDTAWHHVAVTRTSNDVKFYIDGVDAGGGGTMTGALPNSATAVRIAFDEETGSAFNGGMDEVRISNTARSADWIEAQYKSQYGSFNTFGGEETGDWAL